MIPARHQPRRGPPARRKRLAPVLVSAAAIAGWALVVRAQARQAERDNPPTGEFVEVNGVRLHYRAQGRGTPVVLLHGNGATIQDFEISGLLDGAARKYQVIAFDRPGFGHSERPRGVVWTAQAQARLIGGALERLGIERPIVLGHSWGTQVALSLALDHPEAVRALVLLSGYYFPTPRLDVPTFSPPAIPVVGDVMRYTVSPALGRLFAPKIYRKIFEPNPVPRKFAAEFPLELALRPSQIRASAQDTALMVPNAAILQARYRELDLPVTIMNGADDQIVDVGRQASRLARAVRGAELHVLPGLGHMIHHFAQRRILEAIDGVAARSGGADAAPARRAALAEQAR